MPMFSDDTNAEACSSAILLLYFLLCIRKNILKATSLGMFNFLSHLLQYSDRNKEKEANYWIKRKHTDGFSFAPLIFAIWS